MIAERLSAFGAIVARSVPNPALRNAIVVAAIIFLASLLGIWTRSAGALASLWPANAILLGLMARRPDLARPVGWAGATVGYVAADLLTGGGLLVTLLLTIGNLVGVGVGYLLYLRGHEDDRRLARPSSLLYLLGVACAAAASAGVIGAILNPILFGKSALGGWVSWFAIELAGYISILPAVLCAPANAREWLVGFWRGFKLRRLAPALAVVASCALALMIGGPGAVAFPVPALLWCALSYDRFSASLLTLSFGAWTLFAMSRGYLPVAIDVQASQTLLSMRIGVALIALGPIAVASVMAARDDLLRHLEYAAAHDQLTGLLNRRAFTDRSTRLLAELASQSRPVAMLMLDLDHFKKINDSYGHAAGDQTIVAFADLMRGNLSKADVIGRIGGEEFAVLLPDCAQAQADAIAEDIRGRFADVAVSVDRERRIATTVSIGVACALPAPSDLDYLLSIADRALYEAKQAGRNRVAGSGPSGGLTMLLDGLRGADPAPERLSA